MAGYDWKWTVTLERLEDSSYTLSAEQTILDPEDKDEPLEVEPKSGLRRGADIYDAFLCITDEIGEENAADFIDDVADEIKSIDPVVADQFLRGEKLLERRNQRQIRNERARTDDRLKRSQGLVDQYLAGLSDVVDHVGTRTIPSQRDRVRTYLESKLERNEQLPDKEFAIDLVLGSWRSAGPTEDDAPDGWIKVPYRRVSVPGGTGGICPFCGFEMRARPLTARWKVQCRCGATLDYLGTAWLKN